MDLSLFIDCIVLIGLIIFQEQLPYRTPHFHPMEHHISNLWLKYGTYLRTTKVMLIANDYHQIKRLQCNLQ